MEAILVAVVGSFASLISAWWSQRKARRSEEPAGRDIQQRIEQLQGHLNSSAELMAEIQAEFRLQEASLERIKTDAERNQRLAALHQAGQTRSVPLSRRRRAEGCGLGTALSGASLWQVCCPPSP